MKLLTDNKINQMAMSIWIPCQHEPTQAWLDYNKKVNLRKPCNRKVLGEILGTYDHTTPMQYIVDDLRAAERVMEFA